MAIGVDSGEGETSAAVPSLDDEDEEDGRPEISPIDIPGLLDRLPVALKMLFSAELAKRVMDMEALADMPDVADVSPSAATAQKMQELTTAFGRDLELLSARWMKALGPIEGLGAAEMQMIMVAGMTALGTRYHLVQRILRKTTQRERLKAIDKQCQAAARDFLARPADGGRGIRRVK